MLTPTTTRVPHTLRLAIFFLRVLLGLNFFYIGFATLFDKTLQADLKGRSMDGLYHWLDSSSAYTFLHPVSQWVFLVIGACLMLGLATRLASLIGLVLVSLSYLPSVGFAAPNLFQLVNDELIIFFCLLIIFAANAGTYLGLDRFFHFSLRHKAPK
jgi:thiosulfate dehydrogenase (quinone) large subunit